MKKYKNFLLNDFLLIFAILFLLFSIEIFLRLIPQEVLSNIFRIFANRNIYQNDKALGYSFGPNLNTSYQGHSLNTNSKGLRDREFYIGGKPDLRILALGDSFTFGEGVDAEKTYAKVLEIILKKKFTNKKIEVINSGVPGYGNDQELNFLKIKGVYYKPDLVLLGFYLGNDFSDNEIGGIKRRRVKENGFLYDIYMEKKIDEDIAGRNSELLLCHIDRYFKEKSLVYYLIKSRIDNLLWKLGIKKVYDGYRILEKESFPYFENHLTEKYMRGFNLTINIIKEINKETIKSGAKFLVILIPAGFQVYEAAFDSAVTSYNLNKKDYSVDRLDSLVQEKLTAEEIPVLDLLPVLKDKSENRLYEWGHWTPKAHSIAADKIYKFIENAKIILK